PNDPKDPSDPSAGSSQPPADAGPPAPGAPKTSAPSAAALKKIGSQPVVNITMRLDEGKQYYVHTITFAGHTTTHDNVIPREMRLLEGGVFNTEALKYSVRRLNQLGYFKPLEGEAIAVQKTP